MLRHGCGAEDLGPEVKNCSHAYVSTYCDPIRRGTMEVDNVQSRTNTLKRAIDTVTRATEHDLEGMYEEAVRLYDSALTDFDSIVDEEKSQVVRDCVTSKMDAYAYRSGTLKKFLQRCRSPSSDGGSVGATDGDVTETSASSDSGVETVDDLANSHNLSTDSGAEESEYATILESSRDQPRKHQEQSRRQFLDACAEQVEQLLHIIKDEGESEEMRGRARERCVQILDFAEAYRCDFCPSSAPVVERTVSVASSVAQAEPLATHQLVHAEVLLSADTELELENEQQQQQQQQQEQDHDGCPELPDDGNKEFHPLTFSIDSLRFVDGVDEVAGRSDSPDYATARRATPSPRKQLSQASLNRIETESEPLLAARASCVVLPAATRVRPAKWWRRGHGRPEPIDERLAEPSIFWVLLGSICG